MQFPKQLAPERIGFWSTGAILLIVTSILSGCGSLTYHQVSTGETLYSISFIYNQDYRDIARWNGLNSPYIIHEGEWLRVAPPFDSYGETESSSQKNSQVKAPVRPSQTAMAEKIPSASTPITSSSAAYASRDDIEWQWPAKGELIQRFDAKTLGKKGIEIGGLSGDSVKAAASGKIVYSGSGLRGYGNLLIIKHNDKYLSAYAHNREVLVKEGDQVKRGQTIARMGSTEADRVKLHFEIRIDGKPVDPLLFLPKDRS